MRITASEAAKTLGLNEKTIRRMLKDGRLHAEKKDGRFMIDSAEIDALRVTSTVTNEVQPDALDALEGRLSILEDAYLETAFIPVATPGTDTIQPAIDALDAKIARLDVRIDLLNNTCDVTISETGRRFFELQAHYDALISRLEDKITALETALHAVSSSTPVQVVVPPVSGQSAIVEDGVPLLIFAKSHGVSRETLKSQVERGDVPCSQVPIASRPGQTSKFFTLAQQCAVLQYWTAKGTAFTPCPNCPHEPTH